MKTLPWPKLPNCKPIQTCHVVEPPHVTQQVKGKRGAPTPVSQGLDDTGQPEVKESSVLRGRFAELKSKVLPV